MRMALEEAKKGCGWVNPNPMVGAIIVSNGDIIGKGYHRKHGDWHAERNALASCEHNPVGSTMYVTLEPCCHHGKTPPCTDAIIESGISRVVVGSKDPNVLVGGKGIEILRSHGIEVSCGVLEKECKELNEVFFHFITRRTPFLVMKYAMTLDGKTATATGKSKWITGEKARAHVHSMRHQYSSIMVGVGTVLIDDPLLTCRLPGCKNPVRIICDTNLRIPLESKVVETAHEMKTYIATSSSESVKADKLRECGVEIITVPIRNNHIDLREMMIILGEKNIDSILLEGGATLNASALDCGIVNKVLVYIAPKIFGGSSSKSAVGGIGIDNPEDAFNMCDRKITLLDDDILLEYRMK
jgi:diaminohydroxyphosphoribosylaminopyrimidine deaminase/5-amino-6-(5-phosphoribosylamino)uracil reductase